MPAWLDTLLGFFGRRPPGPPVSLAPEGDLLAEVNVTRGRDRAPFAPDPHLMTLAQRHAEQMAARGQLWHQPQVNEAVAAGYRDAYSCCRGWMMSAPHRDIVLGHYIRAGVGAAAGRGGPYWCLVVE